MSSYVHRTHPYTMADTNSRHGYNLRPRHNLRPFRGLAGMRSQAFPAQQTFAPQPASELAMQPSDHNIAQHAVRHGSEPGVLGTPESAVTSAPGPAVLDTPEPTPQYHVPDVRDYYTPEPPAPRPVQMPTWDLACEPPAAPEYPAGRFSPSASTANHDNGLDEEYEKVFNEDMHAHIERGGVIDGLVQQNSEFNLRLSRIEARLQRYMETNDGELLTDLNLIKLY